jgi:hypothetical protein
MTQVNPQTTEASDAPPSLIGLLERQRSLYATLRTLGVEQRKLITQNNAESLLTLLGRRQEVIDQLTPIDTALKTFRADWTGSCAGLRDEERERVDVLVRENRETLTAIMNMDREDSDVLARRKQQVGAELAVVPTHRQVHAAYGATSGAASRYVDRTDSQT